MSVHTIIPPLLLRQLMQHPDVDVRDAAFTTWLHTATLRGQRSVLARTFAPQPEGAETHRAVYDAAHLFTSSGRIARDEGQAPVTDVAVNEVYDALGVASDCFAQVFGLMSLDGQGMRLEGVVHYGDRFNNAFWNGSRLVFGDGDGRLFTHFTRAVDVVGHELAHGVVEFTTGLHYHGESGALNESVADVFGSLVKQYAQRQSTTDADWLIGDTILGPAIRGVALRSLKAPGTAFEGDRQPAHMRDFVHMPDTEFDDNGGVHLNSGIPNHAFYLAATAVGGFSWEHLGPVWYDALRLIRASSTIRAFATATVRAAGERYGVGSVVQLAVIAAWEAVGVHPELPRPRRTPTHVVPVAVRA